jgi:pyruvate formate lyase activating enzyme
MKIRIFQKGFNYSQDGVGNRLVYHLQGCNLRCPWCSNPEGMDSDPPLMVSMDGPLDSVCPYGAINERKLNREVCKGCVSRECVTEHCGTGITCKCETHEVDDLVKEAVDCSPMFFDGGGVTLTGGEVTCQFDAVTELLQKLNTAGIHTAIETNGTHRKLEKLFLLIDQLIMDFKHYDSQTHRAFTETGNEIIIENILKSVRIRKPLFLRIPLINGFNASQEDIGRFTQVFRVMDTSNIIFEFLSYHEFGKDKWGQCDKEYLMKDAFVSDERVKEFEQAFRSYGFTVIRT